MTVQHPVTLGSEQAEPRRVKHWKPLVILVTLCASIVLAEDFRTINGKEYKNATVTRVGL